MVMLEQHAITPSQGQINHTPDQRKKIKGFENIAGGEGLKSRPKAPGEKGKIPLNQTILMKMKGKAGGEPTTSPTQSL